MVLSPVLETVIEDAYRVFAGYGPNGALTVCNCPVCMTKETEAALIATPLREITAGLLAEYTNSAHGWDDGKIADDMRYFLPRYLELIALDDPPDHMGLDQCLRRLGGAGWREHWPQEEAETILRFFDAFLVDSLGHRDLLLWPVGWRLAFDITDVLTLAVTAGGDVARALAAWDAASDPAAALHMAAARAKVAWKEGGWTLRSAYLEGEYKGAAAIIGAFLMRPETSLRIETAIFMFEDERLQQLMSDALFA